MSNASELRRLLTSGQTIVAPGAYDPILAKVVEHLRFSAVYMGGWMTGAHLATTEPQTTLTEMVANASWIVRSVEIPLIVDADAGFGDPLHAMRCVREFEHIGVAGIHIEDQFYPKRASYHRGLEHVTPLNDFLDKMRFAIRARKDEEFVIIARTDARNAVGGSLEETIRRGQALKDLGADVIMPMLRSREDMLAFREAVPDIPLVQLAIFNGPSVEEIAEAGYQVIIYPLAPIITAVGAVLELYSALKETGIAPYNPEKANEVREFIQEIINLPQHFEIEDQTTERG